MLRREIGLTEKDFGENGRVTFLFIFLFLSSYIYHAFNLKNRGGGGRSICIIIILTRKIDTTLLIMLVKGIIILCNSVA